MLPLGGGGCSQRGNDDAVQEVLGPLITALMVSFITLRLTACHLLIFATAAAALCRHTWKDMFVRGKDLLCFISGQDIKTKKKIVGIQITSPHFFFIEVWMFLNH